MSPEALQYRITQLEELLGVNASLTDRIRDCFGVDPLHSQILGMLYRRDHVTRDGLYTVLYEARPESEWPAEKTLDAQICKLRAHLKKNGHEIDIRTRWGNGWVVSKDDKAKIKAAIEPDPKHASENIVDLARYREIGAIGGRARNAKLTPEERTALGKKLNEARWGKSRRKTKEQKRRARQQKATHKRRLSV